MEPACCASVLRSTSSPVAKPEAPSVTQKLGLEWAWRMLMEPRRSDRAMRVAWRSVRGWWFAPFQDFQREMRKAAMTSTITLGLRARNADRPKSRYQICLIHPFVPVARRSEGSRLIRDFITFIPMTPDLLFIGVDSTGDLKLGEIHRLTFRGRTFDSFRSCITRT